MIEPGRVCPYLHNFLSEYNGNFFLNLLTRFFTTSQWLTSVRNAIFGPKWSDSFIDKLTKSLHTAHWNSFVKYCLNHQNVGWNAKFTVYLNILKLHLITLIINCFCKESLNKQWWMFETKKSLFLTDLLSRKFFRLHMIILQFVR